MKDSDEHKTFDRSYHSVESSLNDERLSIQRRHLLKGVALGLPVILTLPRGAAAQATPSLTLTCEGKAAQGNPSAFNPGGTWLVKNLEVHEYIKVKKSDQNQTPLLTIQVYKDKQDTWRLYTAQSPLSPGQEVPADYNFPNGTTDESWIDKAILPAPTSALAYYDSTGQCLWYGPENTIGGTPATTSCYNSLYPTGTPACS